MKKAVERKLDTFFLQYKPLTYQKGKIILSANDPVSSIFLLKSGFVRQYYISKDGEELTLHIFKPMSFFPLMLVLSNSPNKYYFEAVSKTGVLRCPTEEVLAFIKQENDVLFDLTSRFAKGLVGLADRLEELTLGSSHYRICSLLIYLASRLGKKSKAGIEIELSLAHRDIASWVGTTRETASRQLKQLVKKKIISYKKGRFIILDFAGLRKEAENSQKRSKSLGIKNYSRIP